MSRLIRWCRGFARCRIVLLVTVVLAIVMAVVTWLRRDPLLAILGQRGIRSSEFQDYLVYAHGAEPMAEPTRNPAKRQNGLQDFLDIRALAEKARRQGIERELRFQKALELMEMKTLAHLMTERNRENIQRVSQVSPDEVRAYYDQHPQEFAEEARFTAHHLVVYVKGNPAFPEKGLTDPEARAKATDALDKLRAGESWDEVVQSYSDEGANKKGGMIRDGKFGYFAKEIEQAVVTQEIDEIGGPIRTQFGYHLLQVKSRVAKGIVQPFEQVRENIASRLSQERAGAARATWMKPMLDEIGLRVTDVGLRDAFLLDEQAVAADEVLAYVGKRPVLEVDFRWFLKDAFIPSQRISAYSRRGARQSMLRSYLDMLVLQAKACKDGLDKTPDYERRRVPMQEALLAEFMYQRDQAGPFCTSCGDTEEARALAQRRYLDAVRAEVGLSILGTLP